ncbi:MAG: hypothetical protein Q7N50_07315, partial [Armatimonadota bacterium]|nr:hypothetical protein [Armatimonadota bacterium]
MKRSSRTGLFAFGLALLAGIVMLQSDIDPKRDRIQQPLHGREQTELIFQLPGPYILATFTGMRESVAGLLWVRADEFFHQGNYEAIMPLIRLITWLDPHYMDVYKVGAWHLDFNITDKDERSDRRYIPPALALLREGIKNNPDTYDLPFDLAFVHYNLKMRDYENAVKWMKVATDLPDLNPETDDSHQRYPLVVDRMLAHMYEKTGDIESSKKIWKAALAETKRLYKKYPQDGILGRDIDVCMRNYNLMLWRQEHRKWDIRPIVDMKFEANWVRKKPRFIYIS